VSAPPRQTISVLIADDEAPARRGLRDLLDAHADMGVVAEARSGQEAIEAIETLKPDLVFLDIQMPEGDGFEVVRAVGVSRMPVTIFATAYDAYALKAFEVHVLDYLLKPYDRDRFEAALSRARTQLGHSRAQADDKLRSFLQHVDERSRYLRRLAVRVGERTRLVDVAEIEYVEAEANYVRLHGPRGAPLMRETLSALEAKLDPARFVRVHRSLIVQANRVAEVESLFSGEYVLYLHGGARVTTGRTYRVAVQQAFGLRAER
jgi:two-component system LytT family response regulator